MLSACPAGSSGNEWQPISGSPALQMTLSSNPQHDACSEGGEPEPPALAANRYCGIKHCVAYSKEAAWPLLCQALQARLNLISGDATIFTFHGIRSEVKVTANELRHKLATAANISASVLPDGFWAGKASG